MNTNQEKLTVERLERKLAAGEKLTDQEWRVLAYSPYGRGGGCSTCAAPPVPNVTELYRPRVVMN